MRGMSSQKTSCFGNSGAQVVFCVGKVVKRLSSPLEDGIFKANHCSDEKLAASDKFHLEVLLRRSLVRHGHSFDNSHIVSVNVSMYRSVEQR